MTPVEENGTGHDKTTKPDVDWNMAGNHSICVQQLKQKIKNLMRSKDYGHPGNMLLSTCITITCITVSGFWLISSNDRTFS